MKQWKSYLAGAWNEGQGDPIILHNPATEAPVAELRRATDLGAALRHARTVGGPALRALSPSDRGALLSRLAKLVHDHREELIEIAIDNGGNTRGDAKFDIDGGTAVLAAYGHLAGELGPGPWILEGEAEPIMRGSKIRAQHVLVPRLGVAIHINAFNFPAWGMLGKLAVAWLCGMPVLCKPATSTAALAARIAEILIEEGQLPEGALSLLLGPVGDLLDHVDPQDVIAFTGSADTGAKIRNHPAVVAGSVRVNVEADSLNAVVLGPDVEQGTELFDLAIRDLVTELTQKAGQKCTATRRVLVPQDRLEEVREALLERLQELASKTGDPALKEVRMGPLSTAQQLHDARTGVAALARSAERIMGDPERSEFVGVDRGKGWFLEPILFQATAEAALDPEAAFHRLEVFGPVATLLPYDGTIAAAATIVGAGRGSLVSTVYSDDRGFVAEAVTRLAPFLGRLVLADEKTAQGSMSPGCVFPVVNHGGPGRAGGGGELGGRAGMQLYLQRTTIQGGAGPLARLLGTT
ncbi:3,4-dehydroadipyl-CoA semialdehyde dehydrogenase [Paraliomyxa miuraensis]|uniref:3,4-dehydroadipyl-CoA semialdehyde dehydrogenase n=1 Tax=Paraliomyxa miuraensis TaxID=376150 RepID=UPI0022580620|nr:3,4-dehydroadipyl-CoA semialdehyde dehydrogenase [Paraliomyxa miuraensis]MCX4243166.1 3,4-dehydroadipyl-CoA semialdehyde dehydrogenase [Paraliomyxa miuraensis]